MRGPESEIAIVGAGVVGMACALWLVRAGREVVLIDPEVPGSGASYGNAGTIADYAVQPVGTPGVLKALPQLLFDRDSPLAIRRAALPALAPWLIRFARQSLPGAARRNAVALAELLSDATGAWESLAVEIGAERLIRRKGCLYLYETAAAARAAAADLTFRRDLGIGIEMLMADELRAIEPALPEFEGGAAWFRDAIFLDDPGAVMARLAETLRAAGARFLTVRIDRLDRQPGGVRLSGPGLSLRARHVVIAAGARSRALARQAGSAVPLDTERGYHVEWDMAAPRLGRPASPTTRGFYLCPMRGRLRAAGTVELGGLAAPPSPHRIARLAEGARRVFPDLGAPSRSWMGLRPSMPDSLPVIGPSGGGSDVILAFGHGHIGLTLAPRTARIVAGLILGGNEGVPAATHPGRF